MWPLRILFSNSIWWYESLCVWANSHFMRYSSIIIKQCHVLKVGYVEQTSKKPLSVGLECYHPPVLWIITHCLCISKGIPYCHIPTFQKPLHYSCIFGSPETLLFAGWCSLLHSQNICWTTTYWWEVLCLYLISVVDFLFSKNWKYNLS